MADLIAFRAPEYRPTTLDEVWREAEALGRVSVEKSIFGKYRAQIAFDTKHGSCYAKAEHDHSALIALGLAINNARQLGAGELG